MMVKNENGSIRNDVMFDTATTTESSADFQAKMTVADILNNMSTGVIPADYQDYTESSDIMDISGYTSSASAMHGLMSALPYSSGAGMIMATTPLTTPTSLTAAAPWLYSSELSSPAGTGPSTLAGDQYLHGGSFAPPVVAPPAPVASSSRGARAAAVGPTSYATHPAPSAARSSPSAGRRRLPDSQFPPQEREKRRLRRERNKVAAAKCRQRRVDQTNCLLEETEDWEDKNANLESEISKLQQQKEQLEFVLEAHQASCKMLQGGARPATSTSTATMGAGKRPAARTATFSFPSTSGLHTPITEVVTPTSGIFTFEPFQQACGVEASKVDSSSSDLSSPDSAKLVSL